MFIRWSCARSPPFSEPRLYIGRVLHNPLRLEHVGGGLLPHHRPPHNRRAEQPGGLGGQRAGRRQASLGTFFLFSFSFVCLFDPIPSTMFALLFLPLPPFCISDPLVLLLGPHSGHSSPLPSTVHAFSFLWREDLDSFFPHRLASNFAYPRYIADRRIHAVRFCTRQEVSLVGGARTRQLDVSSYEVSPLHK